MAVADAKFFTWEEYRSYVSPLSVDRAFDDNNIGEADESAVAAIFQETDRAVIRNVVKNYPEEVADSVNAANCHPTLKSLALQYAKCATVFRMPTVFRCVDPIEEMKMARTDLKDIALGKTHLDGSEQSNARVEVRNGVRVGGSTCKTFSHFGDY